MNYSEIDELAQIDNLMRNAREFDKFDKVDLVKRGNYAFKMSNSA
jgi:hypothetical protein